MSDKKRGFSRFLTYLFPKKISLSDTHLAPDASRHPQETVQLTQNEEDNNDANSFKTQSSTSKYEQERFSSYREKITELCKSIGLGKLTSQERLKGGSFNRVIGLELAMPDLPPCVIRIPRLFDKCEEPESVKIANQVSTLAFIRRQDLPTAEVLAYDITSNNALESEYMIQTRAAGVPLESVLPSMSLEERKSLITQMVPLIVQMENVEFFTAGKIIAPSKIPAVACLSKATLDDPIVPGFMVGPPIDEKILPTTSGASIKTLMHNQLNAWIEYECREYPEGRNASDRPWYVDWLEDLIAIATQMEDLELIKPEPEDLGSIEPAAEPNVLYHWDFQPRNILVDKHEEKGWQITAILDWDEVLSVPRMLSRKPPIWLYKANIPEDSTQGNPDLMGQWAAKLSPDETFLRAHFDCEIEKALPGYCADAYWEGAWVRRLWAFAQDALGSNEDFDRCDKFLKDWEGFMKEVRGGAFISSIRAY